MLSLLPCNTTTKVYRGAQADAQQRCHTIPIVIRVKKRKQVLAHL